MTIRVMRLLRKMRVDGGLHAAVLASAGMLIALSLAFSPSALAEDGASAAAPVGEASPVASDTAATTDAAAASAVPSADESASEGPMTESAATPEANPYGLSALWAQGDLVAKGTLVILAIMSMGSWYILVIKLWEQRGLFAQGRTARKVLASSPNLKQARDALSKASPFRAVADEGLAAAEQHGRGLSAQVSLIDWTGNALNRAIDNVSSELQGGLAFLATVGSTAPFVGLFGTVWGIYHALIAIGVAGQASIDKVAGPVGEALIMTAIGLAVAVPAVLGYNWLVRRNKAALNQVRRFATEVEARILAGA
ncbi:MAG: MotA/TolQ/ExbB proton channel family protein [Parvibaculum sp.]|uniref:MotA/TolQ/ExbB proton channel family protein n=1 Tax=Parvibaculum sp. TaxID=2024848 RepID=UPI0028501DC6|nr:MotA/TolQ/ExbB proton channel family protein [Parvibaculum sp.]MDR3499068.1 MotA/TolQ/ExbB proton channel family protein [Parvibaculum sp.]